MRQRASLFTLLILLFSQNAAAFNQGLCKEFYQRFNVDQHYTTLRCWYGTNQKDEIRVNQKNRVIINGQDVGVYTQNSVNLFLGFAGNDKIYGGNGRNIILGMIGNDELHGQGISLIQGGRGWDRIWTTTSDENEWGTLDILDTNDACDAFLVPATMSRNDLVNREITREIIADTIRKFDSEVDYRRYTKK